LETNVVRIALGLEYDGQGFYGWQYQPSMRTVQSEVERVLSSVANHPVRVHCAGRTDTGVHASGQVVHFDSECERSPRAWTFGVNSQLPKDIAVNWVKYVDDDFHARFRATARQYRYFLYNNPNRPGLFQSQLSWQCRPLDHKLMGQAAQYLLGEHDFTSYRAVGCQSKSPRRRIARLDVKRQGDLIIIDVKANAFLHHMVRNIVGVLISIGLGKHEVEWTQELLEAKNRCLGGVTAPPNGLFLTQVSYPQRWSLPASSTGPLLFND
jgi:tRNA pseudouridine38-40 synthase